MAKDVPILQWALHTTVGGNLILVEALQNSSDLRNTARQGMGGIEWIQVAHFQSVSQQ